MIARALGLAPRTLPRCGAEAIIREFEGCKLRAYKCPAGVWTIGYGATGDGIGPGAVWTRDQAEARLRADLESFRRCVDEAVYPGLSTRGQTDAMVSLAFNIGCGAFARSTLARLHRTGRHDAAAEQFGAWVKVKGVWSKGLARRRKAERSLYKEGD